MFKKISLFFTKKNFYQQVILKKEIENFLKKQKIEDQTEIKPIKNKIKIFCKDPATFHFLKLKERNFKKILKNFPSFEVLISLH
ncbi:hypothetical protein J7J41_01335 [bacterium]|nr:hypothetical protein [bacterium]